MSTFVAIENAVLGTVEHKSTAKGTSLANFQVAVEQGYGQKKETGTMKLTAWGDLADQLAGLEAGTKLNIYGRLNARTYEWEGRTKHATDIVADAVSVRFTGKARAAAQDSDDSVPF